jgi:hypothetical protein
MMLMSESGSRPIAGLRTMVSSPEALLTIVPDSGIVNFYNLKDTLMGHVDRAE